MSKFQYDREFEGCGFVSLRLLCVTLAQQSRLLLLLLLSLSLLLLLLLNAVTNCQSELLFFPEIDEYIKFISVSLVLNLQTRRPNSTGN